MNILKFAARWARVLAVVLIAFPALAGGPTVVELFTSQGCSSCPPAAAFLGELTKRDDVLALAFHVDYWDYIGWKDPFADPKYTSRQRHYSAKLGLRYVFTPQMVVQGASSATGSNQAAVLGLIGRDRGMDRVEVKMSRDASGLVTASLPASPDVEEADIWVVFYDRKHVTEIKRGENGGRTLRNYNVVRKLVRLGSWRGEVKDFPIQAMSVGDACAVLVQSVRTGRILGAATQALDN
jgi:hypothetical protein